MISCASSHSGKIAVNPSKTDRASSVRSSFSRHFALFNNNEIFLGFPSTSELKTLKDFSTSSLGYGDEGGFAPNLENDEEALKVLVKAISEAGYIPGKDIKLAIDAASSEWYENESGTYYLPKSKKRLTRVELVDMWERFVNTYPIVSIEDAMGEIDIEGWKMFLIGLIILVFNLIE